MTTDHLDIPTVREQHLRTCTVHDAGLAGECACPETDPRSVLGEAVDELEQTRAALATAYERLDQMTDRDAETVAGRCPGCGRETLILAAGGHVTCPRLGCPAPEAADELLHGGPPDRRREWTAALRWAADDHRVVVDSEHVTILTDFAAAIEAGELSPWQQDAPAEATTIPLACSAVAPADDADDHECDLADGHSGPHECAGCGATWSDAPAPQDPPADPPSTAQEPPAAADTDPR